MELTDPMAIIWSSTGPTYQLKVRDLSEQGAGIVVKTDSNFLKMIEVGQEIDVELILPRDCGFKGSSSGILRSRVEHITEIQEGRFKGHINVGLSFLTGLESGPSHLQQLSEQPSAEFGGSIQPSEMYNLLLNLSGHN